eukprot:scaffold46117_cov57-Attheya_sp.AAC.5
MQRGTVGELGEQQSFTKTRIVSRLSRNANEKIQDGRRLFSSSLSARRVYRTMRTKLGGKS